MHTFDSMCINFPHVPCGLSKIKHEMTAEHTSKIEKKNYKFKIYNQASLYHKKFKIHQNNHAKRVRSLDLKNMTFYDYL